MRDKSTFNRSPNGAGSRGFTLIEVVMAMFLLLLGMTSILGLLSFGAAMARTAELRSSAAQSIQAVLADLEESLFPLVLDEAGEEVAGEPLPIADQPLPGYPNLVYSATATPNPDPQACRSDSGAALEYLVKVEISWSTSGLKRSRKFETLLLREVPFGARLRRRFVEGEKPLRPDQVSRDPSSPE
ncbi:MAG: hypothetical protein CMJ89_01355 [Planctomycetes bacterium]|jgi:prepilin-type N-terminal cleavage/methylation domain-containing protein|nr:hypothetical protein [Planctomycetota bacterium]